jgi:uncharacterized membrane protein YeaQ/YmgE (transglycosylase-associated protein family)
MGVISWIILELIADFVASKILNRTGSGLILDLVLRMVETPSHSFVSRTARGCSATSDNNFSIAVTTCGAFRCSWAAA